MATPTQTAMPISFEPKNKKFRANALRFFVLAPSPWPLAPSPMSFRKIAGLRSLVTGASGGIGRAIAVELARQGSKVVLLARREDALVAAGRTRFARPAERAEWVAGDVTDPAVRQAAIDRAVEKFGGLDVLVNNAGIGATGRFDMAQPERLRKIFEVNFFAAAELTREALPLLRQGNRPIVVNIASVLGHRGGAADERIQRQQIRPARSEPGLANGAVSVGNRCFGRQPRNDRRRNFSINVVGGDGTTRWPRWGAVSAAAVARATVRAMRLGRHEIIPNFPRWCFRSRIGFAHG